MNNDTMQEWNLPLPSEAMNPVEALQRYTLHPQVMSAVGKMCKEVSKRYDCPVVALSQINKDNSSRADKKPAMTDIRYGGHEIADAVSILKENEDTIVPDGFKHIEAHIVKNRNGPGVGKKADMLFNGSTMTFVTAPINRVNLNT